MDDHQTRRRLVNNTENTSPSTNRDLKRSLHKSMGLRDRNARKKEIRHQPNKIFMLLGTVFCLVMAAIFLSFAVNGAKTFQLVYSIGVFGLLKYSAPLVIAVALMLYL